MLFPCRAGRRTRNANYRWIREETARVAGERNLPVIDLWTAFLAKAEYYKDATHLTEAGRRRLAQVVADAITVRRKPGARNRAAKDLHIRFDSPATHFQLKTQAGKSYRLDRRLAL